MAQSSPRSIQAIPVSPPTKQLSRPVSAAMTLAAARNWTTCASWRRARAAKGPPGGGPPKPQKRAQCSMQPPSEQKAPPPHLSRSRSVNGMRPAMSPARTAALHVCPRQRMAVAVTRRTAPVDALTVERPTATNEMATSASTIQPICSAQRSRPPSYACRARAARSADAMIPPRGAQPHQRALDALAKRRRRHRALDDVPEGGGAQRLAIGRPERAEHSERPRLELGGHRLRLRIARAIGDRGQRLVTAGVLAPARRLLAQRQTFVAGDADDPRQRVARRVELAGALEQLAQRALRGVVDVGGGAHHASGDFLHFGPGEVEDRAERRAIAVGEPAEASLQLHSLQAF